MRNTIIILISLVFCSCQNTGNKKVFNQDNKAQKESTNTIFVDFGMDMFTEKVFEAGNKNHFNNNCVSDFRCDCCMSHFVFNSDSTFYYKGFCEADEYISTGRFSIERDQLIARLDGYTVTNKYNWENEIDTGVIDYHMIDTNSISFQVSFDIGYCREKIQLMSTQGSEMALETKDDYEEVLNEMIEKGFLSFIKNNKQKE